MIQDEGDAAVVGQVAEALAALEGSRRGAGLRLTEAVRDLLADNRGPPGAGLRIRYD